MMARRVYLDNAATTWPKCSQATAAAFEFAEQCGATAGRGAYASALQADNWVANARRSLARLIGAPSGDDIALCYSGTHALNAALFGMLRTGDDVLTTDIEHNSVLRPLQAICESRGISVSHVRSDTNGLADIVVARELLERRKAPKLLCVGHASNVTGVVQDLSAWRALADQCGALLLVDASQTLGYLPIDVRASGIDLLAAAGHKGLRALSGSGLLYVRSDLQTTLQPLMYGGTGRISQSLETSQPWPANVEVGNLNLLAIVSMAVAAEAALAPESLSSWQAAFERLRLGLRQITAIQLVADDCSVARIPVQSIMVDGWDVHDLASILDTSFGIEVRAGWHCAARVHAALGSAATGGTLRLSPGHSTSLDEIDFTLAAFQAILG
ncbi:MAG: aminotransferase class V-fold PLP-dependent enzyme [Pirellulaceae bacterium]